MKPKKVTIEGETVEQRLALADEIITRAALMIVSEVGLSADEMIDRMLTYAAATASTTAGSPKAADVFRLIADRIEGGLFFHLTGEGEKRGEVH